MSDNSNKNSGSTFTKMAELSSLFLDAQIQKAKNVIASNTTQPAQVQPQNVGAEDFLYAKTITEDPIYAVHAAGWKDRYNRIQNGHLKQMSVQDTAIAVVIQTRQNQVAAHSKLVKSEQEKGFMVCLVDEDAELQKIKEELKNKIKTSKEESEVVKLESPVAKSIFGEDKPEESENDQDLNGDGESDDQDELIEFELERKAKEVLRKNIEKEKKEVEDYILNCGVTPKRERPHEHRKWNFDSTLRSWVRDTLTYDLVTTETVAGEANSQIQYFFPVDAGTMKRASTNLDKFKSVATNSYSFDILYPEKAIEEMNNQETLKIDDKKLENGDYTWCQVIRGKIERAYTDDELKVGIRNLTTDIYNNGYGISELELLVGMVTGHINAEFYNQAYFTQGFSSKGILHIKAAIPRRKLETIRTEWQHMLKGARNSFQTPIFAGVDDVKWVPLTQNHTDIGFEGWMRYLVRMICGIYQIDPHECGFNFKDEGSGGSGMSGDNTKAKIDNSKDRGLIPLLRFFETYINDNIVTPFNPKYCIKFTGMTAESREKTLERQEKEVKFKKTVNEIRAEDGLSPLPGMDDVILDVNYMAWYNQYSAKGQANMDKMQAAASQPPPGVAPTPDEAKAEEEKGQLHTEDDLNNLFSGELDEVQKSKKISVEVYKLED